MKFGADGKTVEVVLVRKNIHVAPQSKLYVGDMLKRFPLVVEFLSRSYKPSSQYDDMTLMHIRYPLNCIDNSLSKNPFLLTREYGTAMIDYLISKNIVMIEESEKDIAHKIAFGNQDLYYSVTEIGRQILGKGLRTLKSVDVIKQRSNYTFISKFYTGPGWADHCIYLNCKRSIVRDNEYSLITELGLNCEQAVSNGFAICIGCTKNLS